MKPVTDSFLSGPLYCIILFLSSFIQTTGHIQLIFINVVSFPLFKITNIWMNRDKKILESFLSWKLQCDENFYVWSNRKGNFFYWIGPFREKWFLGIGFCIWRHMFASRTVRIRKNEVTLKTFFNSIVILWFRVFTKLR